MGEDFQLARMRSRRCSSWGTLLDLGQHQKGLLCQKIKGWQNPILGSFFHIRQQRMWFESLQEEKGRFRRTSCSFVGMIQHLDKYQIGRFLEIFKFF